MIVAYRRTHARAATPTNRLRVWQVATSTLLLVQSKNSTSTEQQSVNNRDHCDLQARAQRVAAVQSQNLGSISNASARSVSLIGDPQTQEKNDDACSTMPVRRNNEGEAMYASQMQPVVVVDVGLHQQL